jgi:mannose-6-phosphate isomerase-like protein (cupin superfamily)
VGELDTGAELEWGTEHGDEALFVLEGGLDCGGQRIVEGSCLIVEAGVPTVARSAGPTQLVHFGPNAITAPAQGLFGAAGTEGRGVHVVPPEEAPSIRFKDGTDTTATYFRDGTCSTCRVAFFMIDGTIFTDGYVGASHLHSEDEIMHVLEGELHVGPLSVAAGACIAVPRDLRYSFRTSGPFRFLNYRADVSTALVNPGSDPVLETVSNLNSLGGGVSR